MGQALLIAVTLIYTGIAVDQAVKAAFPQAIVYGGYAIANIGMWFWIR